MRMCCECVARIRLPHSRIIGRPGTSFYHGTVVTLFAVLIAFSGPRLEAQTSEEPVSADATEKGEVVSEITPSAGFWSDEDFETPQRRFCRHCESPSWIWGCAEYVFWWTDTPFVDPLVTTSTDGTAAEDAGVLGVSTTDVLYGHSNLFEQHRPGGRYEIGLFPDSPLRVVARYTSMPRLRFGFLTDNIAHSIVARPFVNLGNGEDSRLIAYPDVTEGSVKVSGHSDFDSPELNFRLKTAYVDEVWIDTLLGYRYARLDDDIYIRESTRSLAAPTVDYTFQVVDQFSVKNRFDGGTIGIGFLWEDDSRWSVDFTTKASFGHRRTQVFIQGSTRTTDTSGVSTTNMGGLLTQPTNINDYEDNRFTCLFELDFTVKYRIVSELRATFGYSFIQWFDVARASDQIDRIVNTTQIPPGSLVGHGRPGFPAWRTDFLAQGLRIGLEYSF